MAIKKTTYIIEVDTKNGKVRIDGLTNGFVKAEAAAKRLNKTLMESKQTMTQTSSTAGIAGAAVVEMGRLASDAGFGMMAMANNIQQLSTLLVLLSQTAGGVAAGFKALWAQLMGPLGLVVAFQGLIAWIEWSTRTQNQAESSAVRMGKAYETAATGLEVLLQKRKEAGTISDEEIQGFEDRIMMLKQEALVRAQIAEIQKLQGELVKLEQKSTTELVKWWQKALIFMKDPMAFRRGGLKFDDAMKMMGLGEENRKEQAESIESEIAEIIDSIDPESLAKMFKDKAGKGGKAKKISKLILDSLGVTGLPEALKRIPEEFRREAEAGIVAGDTSPLLDLLIPDEETARVEFEKRSEELAFLAKEYALSLADDFALEMVNLVDARYQRELTIEQNATTEKNNELRKRLLNERLSVNERKQIQNQIAINDELLRKKQEVIEKKRFKMQKAANIAQATIETYLAAAKALKNFGGVPTGLPAMWATIAVGLAQVATIASTKFQSSASSAGVALSPFPPSDEGDRQNQIFTPGFNIVGNSGINQLGEVIAGSLDDKPQKAYITTRDVKTAAELERNIIEGGTIGS